MPPRTHHSFPVILCVQFNNLLLLLTSHCDWLEDAKVKDTVHYKTWTQTRRWRRRFHRKREGASSIKPSGINVALLRGQPEPARKTQDGIWMSETSVWLPQCSTSFKLLFTCSRNLSLTFQCQQTEFLAQRAFLIIVLLVVCCCISNHFNKFS